MQPRPIVQCASLRGRNRCGAHLQAPWSTVCSGSAPPGVAVAQSVTQVNQANATRRAEGSTITSTSRIRYDLAHLRLWFVRSA
jgi:hypothetical protein